MTNHILLTGASGFIGSHLTDRLQSDYRLSGQVRRLVNPKVDTESFFKLNVNGQSDWRDLLASVNTVIHLACIAHNKSFDHNYIKEVNVDGTVNLAQQSAKKGVKRFIFISSITVFGHSVSSSFNEDSNLNPYLYSAKLLVEIESKLLKIGLETGMKIVIVRSPLVYGVNAPANIDKLFNLVKRLPVLPFALCENKRSFISIDNLVDFIDVCISHPKAANEVFCISDGVDVSIREFTDEIAKGLNKKLIQLPMPIFLFKLLGFITGKSNLIEQLIGDLQVDSSKARTLLDWAPPKTMTETLSKLVKVK